MKLKEIEKFLREAYKRSLRIPLEEKFSFRRGYDCSELAIAKRISAESVFIDEYIKKYEEEPSKKTATPEDLLGILSEFFVLPFFSFEWSEDHCYVLSAAAIWIIDELKRTGKIKEAYEFLPSNEALLEDAVMPFFFEDSCNSYELLSSVLYTLQNRNLEQLEKARRTQQRFILDELTLNQTQRRNTGEIRTVFDKLIALLPPETVNSACAYFQEKQKELLDRFVKAFLILKRREARLREQKEALEERVVGAIVSSPLKRPDRPVLDSAVNRLKELDDIEAELKAVSDQQNKVIYYLPFIQKNRKEFLQKNMGKRAADCFEGFKIENPYEICFALLYLLDTGSSIPFVYNPSAMLLETAARSLPWSFSEFEKEERWRPKKHSGKQEAEHAYDPLSQRMAVGESNTSCILQGNEDEQTIASIAETVYDLTGVIMPRFQSPFAYKRKELLDEGLDERTVDRIILTADLLELQNKKEDDYRFRTRYVDEFEEEAEADAAEGDETADESDSDRLAKAEEENERLRRELKQLQNSLHESGRQLREMQKRAEKEREAGEEIRKELADLRELVFHQQEKIYEEDKTEQKSEIVFPYAVRGRYVVFGGHDSWLREIRIKLPGVRFVDRDTLPNTDLIRCADVVWIQPNAISHSNFYAIVNICKSSNVPLRYFTYAGVIRCAEQLAKADPESECGG